MSRFIDRTISRLDHEVRWPAIILLSEESKKINILWYPDQIPNAIVDIVDVTRYNWNSDGPVVKVLRCKSPGSEFQSDPYMYLQDVSQEINPRPYILGETSVEAI